MSRCAFGCVCRACVGRPGAGRSRPTDAGVRYTFRQYRAPIIAGMRWVSLLFCLFAGPVLAQGCAPPSPSVVGAVGVVLPAGPSGAPAGARLRIALGPVRLEPPPPPCPLPPLFPSPVPRDILRGDAPSDAVLHGPPAADLLRGPDPPSPAPAAAPSGR